MKSERVAAPCWSGRTCRPLGVGFLLWNALLTPAVSGAEPAPGVHSIGYLNPGSAALAPIRLEPLRQGLRELGYVEGRNLVLDSRWGEGNFEGLGAMAADLVRLKVAVIVTAGAAAAQAARNATSSVPIVMVTPATRSVRSWSPACASREAI